MRKNKLSDKILRNIFGVAVFAAVLTAALITATLYNYLEKQNLASLRGAANLIASGIHGDTDAYLKSLAIGDYRITWIDENGDVLYDSELLDAENHADRPEVASALSGIAASSSRYSDSIAHKTINYAVPLRDGTVLRVSKILDSVFTILLGMISQFFIIGLSTFILALIMADVMSKRIIRPILSMNLDGPGEGAAVYEELTPLVSRISSQKQRTLDEAARYELKQTELSTITGHMSEGLVVLDSNSRILMLNQSAQRLFSVTEESCVGYSPLTLCRTAEFQSIINKAKSGKVADDKITLDGRIYRVLANPVIVDERRDDSDSSKIDGSAADSAGGISGTVMLILDVTETEKAEQMRREFSANVSHELKTPLTSISGYAEIMKTGVARPEDMAEFASRISDEATRLIALIDDIIKLSRLDEHIDAPDSEPVNLLELAGEICDQLSKKAAEVGVEVFVEGKDAAVLGSRRILDEIIFNLLDNAIKYNRPGGIVRVTVDNSDGTAVLTVRDTGIGISREHHLKVFERFYRVDKSHSKASGGTGLGLSIVKHGAQASGAKIELNSAEGVGTEIKLIFNQVD